VKREVLKRGKGEKVSISIVCNEERERERFFMGSTPLLF